jgi:hypothetical protein
MELAPNGQRIRHVLEYFRAEHRVETFCRHGDGVGWTGEVNPSAVAIIVASRDAGDVVKVSPIRLLPATNINQFSPQSRCQPGDAAFDKMNRYEGGV